ncbi:hypothetical protein PG5_63550 [Pseudomonas sp. G5(2012)]|nr:hypothetical protein PG5_63550 [Pseudomonas sp. G5(2012)]
MDGVSAGVMWSSLYMVLASGVYSLDRGLRYEFEIFTNHA